MFEFNAYDCYGNEYVCVYENGTHRVYLIEGDESYEQFEGNYSDCRNFIELTLLAARESMY